jgi:hypothetical protein
MKGLSTLFTFIIFFTFLASTSFSQVWKKVTNYEFKKNILGAKIANDNCNFKFEKGGIAKGMCISSRGIANFISDYTFRDDNYCRSTTVTTSGGKIRAIPYKCSIIYISGNRVKFGDDVYKLETKPSKVNFLKVAFNSLSSSDRKTIQTSLLAQGYYNSFIDGSYGKGTEKALRQYNKKYFSNADLKKKNNISTLLAKLQEEEVPTPKVVAKKVEEKKVVVTTNNETKSISSEWQSLAREGSAKAQYKLASMYEKGEGTLKDFVYAHMWANLSATNGYAEAKDLRDTLENKMTASQMEKAQDLARECMKKKYKGC